MGNPAFIPNDPPRAASLRTASPVHDGFTLVEVLVALVIFALGFTMVAGVVPAGHLLNRQAEDDVLAAIAGRNAVAAVEARKIYAPAFEHAMMHATVADGAYTGGNSATTDPQAAANGGQVWGLEAAFRTGVAVDDFEKAFATGQAWPTSWPLYLGGCPGRPNASTGFRFFEDTNGDGGIPVGDDTNLDAGRIHAYHKRAGWNDALPLEDLAYPGYTPTLSARPYICIPLALDANANPNNRRWVGLMAVLRRHGGDTWPERSSGTAPHVGDGARGIASLSLQSSDISPPDGKHPNGNGGWNTYAIGTANDPTTPNPDLPGLYCLPMIVYDFNNNLIEAQYPDCWAPAVSTANPSAIDRRLKAGDLFIAREGGTVFTVVSARDAGNDAHLQVIEVAPPLRTTLLSANAGPTPPSAPWRLRAGFFAPPPAAGGSSPLIRVETLSSVRGFTANPNH